MELDDLSTNMTQMDKEEAPFPNSSLLRVLNVTNKSPIQFALPLYGYIAPILLVITIVANTLIILVLSKRHMRTPTNIVLLAMAISDMLTILFPAPWLFYMYTFGNHYKPLSPITACYAYTVMNDTLPNLFHTASIWLTLCLAVQRYIYVCHAPVARTWCTISRVYKGIVLIFLLAFLHQSTRFFDRSYKQIDLVWRGENRTSCAEVLRHWVVDVVTEDVYFSIYYWFRVICVHSLPCVFLVLLNALLFAALRRAQKKRERLFKENKKNESKKLRDSNSTTMMLIVVVTVFLLVEIPLAVVTLVHIISNVWVNILDYRVAKILILLTNFFIMVSYPINFAIYCGMSRQFRETFKDLFIRGPLLSKSEDTTGYTYVNGPKTATETAI